VSRAVKNIKIKTPKLSQDPSRNPNLNPNANLIKMWQQQQPAIYYSTESVRVTHSISGERCQSHLLPADNNSGSGGGGGGGSGNNNSANSGKTAQRGEKVDGRLVSFLLLDPTSDGGQWDMLVNLITKHGLMPKKCFPESFSCESSIRMNAILKSKVRESFDYYFLVLHRCLWFPLVYL